MDDPLYADPQEEEGSSPFDLKVLLLYGVFRSKLQVVLLTGLGIFGGLLFGAAQPNEYASEAQLWYTPGERERHTEEELAGVEGGRSSVPGVTDEIMLLDNPLLYEKVAAELGPAWLLEPADPTHADTEDTSVAVRMLHQLQKALIALGGPDGTIRDDDPKAIRTAGKRLRKSTDLLPVRGSAIIRVIHRGTTREKAQRINAALVDAYVARHQEVFGAEGRVDDQEQKVQEAYEVWKKAEEEHNQYRQSCGVFDYEIEWEKNRLTLEKIDDETRAKEGELKALTARIDSLEKDLADIDATVAERVDAVNVPNPYWTELNKQKMQLDMELLMVDSSSTVPQIVEKRRKALEESLANLKKELEAVDMFYEVMPERVENKMNQKYYDLDGLVVDLKSQRNAVIAEIEILKENAKQEAERRKLIATCKSTHVYHGVEVERTRLEYEAQLGRLTKLKKLAGLDEEGHSNLRVSMDPTRPEGKTGPNRMKPLLAGTFGGAVAGVAFAVLRQLLDRRLRYPESIEKGLGLKVLGVVPEVRKLRNLPRSPTAA